MVYFNPQLQDLLGNIEAALRPELVSGRGAGLEGYLQSLAPRREKMLSLYSVVVREGGSLCQSLRRTPGLGSMHSGGGESARKVKGHLRTLQVHWQHVEELWERAWQVVRRGKQVGQRTICDTPSAFISIPTMRISQKKQNSHTKV